MPAIFLTESDVTKLLDLPTAIEAVREGFRQLANGTATDQPRVRVRGGGVMLHTLTAGSRELGRVGFKVYATTRSSARFLIGLADESGDWLALVEANALGRIRTAAATAIATDLLARTDAVRLGVIGTGFQAEAQIDAILEVRPITEVAVFGRSVERRETFAEACRTRWANRRHPGPTIQPVTTPEDAVRTCDILVTVTTSKTPVFNGHTLADGTHINLVGGNSHSRSEIDDAGLQRADRIVCDSITACQREAGEFIEGINSGWLRWEGMGELGDLVIGAAPARPSPDAVTIFKSVGLGLEDLMAVSAVYDRAIASGIGHSLPF